MMIIPSEQSSEIVNTDIHHLKELAQNIGHNQSSLDFSWLFSWLPDFHWLKILLAGLLPVYFGSLAFCYILVFTCMLLLQWRKQILQKRRAKVWMKQLKAESYFQHALAHGADEEAQPRTNAAICSPDHIPEPQSLHLPSENIVESNDNSTPPFPDSAPYKPIFQEVACVCALSHLPPLLAHSASYPCSAIPTESSPFSSPLKPTILKNDPYSIGSRISA
ncbi:testis-expressed protein 38 [Pantherophis guttatus]|uniref:Testis-expressed protein 38 n=1 Tax=Pantherophis guttatus TaxID=94885 RepID=A0A6P9BSL4_PANGU|nr:testis-expressed protein 38 [Pantherophis guttatus]